MKQDMEFIRTTLNDSRFKKLTILLDNELQGNYGDLQKNYDTMNVIDNEAHVILCILRKKAIACGCIRNTDNENIVELKRMYTIKSERGKGIGKQMMLKAIEIADGNLALHVEPDNPARFLYEKIGFTNKYLEMRYIKP